MNEMQEGLSMNADSQDIEIDFGRIFSSLLQFSWVIVLLALLGGSLMYAYSKFVLPPVYQSTASLYIHDKNVTSSAGGVGTNDDQASLDYNTIGGNAATYLMNTYRRTLISDTTLSIVIDNLNLPYSCGGLRGMITTKDNDYPYFDITVTCDNPVVAAQIANELANVLYAQVSKIVGGSSLTHVDEASPPQYQSGPNVLKNVILGFAAGMALACCGIVLLELTNNKINDDEYLMNQYGISVLASITDFNVTASRKGYRYYKKHGAYQTYYGQD